VLIKALGRRAADMVSIVISGKRGDYPVLASDPPVQVTIVLGDQEASIGGRCGERRFATSSCSFNRSGRNLTCR